MTLLIRLICSVCGAEFEMNPASYAALGLGSLPKTCPACKDREQYRAAVVLNRRELFAAVVKLGQSVMDLLRHAEVFQPSPRDIPAWRLIVKGRSFGADWQGRIDVYLHVDPKALSVGQLVRLAHMESRSKVWVKRWQRGTLEHGTISGYRRCGPKDEGAEEREEVTQYVTILPAPDSAEPGGTLVWAQAYSKTTLKGFGRQYAARLEGSPLWQMSVYGAARSGRFHTDARLAIVEEGNPLIHVHREGGEEERTPVLS